MSESVDTYYDSDDDISCGPITLREVKRNLRSNIGCRKPKHRVTVGYNTPPSMENNGEDENEVEDIKDVIEDVSKLSLNSKYFTPHETLASMMADNSATSVSLYKTLESLDDKPNQVTEQTNCNEESTKNYNTIYLSDDFLHAFEIKEENENREDDIIEISDEEDSLKEIVEEIKNNIDNESFGFKEDIIDYQEKSSKNANKIDGEAFSFEEDSFYIETPNKKTNNIDFPKIKETCDEMLRYQGVQSKYENISGICNLENSLNKSDLLDIFCEENSALKSDKSEIFPEEKSLARNVLYMVSEEKSPSLSSKEHYFNDTLEEIENLLAKGLNYSMKYDSTEKQQISSVFSEPNKTYKSKIPLRPQNPKKMYENVVSPIATYIKTPSPFKVPMKPKKCSPSVQNVLRPPKTNYKDITSPVGLYIKHSSKAPIYQRVQNCAFQKPIENTTSPKNPIAKENTQLPTAIYRPAKQIQTVTEENKYNLPTSVKKLFTTKIQTFKHEKKIVKPLDSEDKEKQLQEGDLTINFNVNSTSADISILKCRDNIM